MCRRALLFARKNEDTHKNMGVIVSVIPMRESSMHLSMLFRAIDGLEGSIHVTGGGLSRETSRRDVWNAIDVTNACFNSLDSNLQRGNKNL